MVNTMNLSYLPIFLALMRVSQSDGSSDEVLPELEKSESSSSCDSVFTEQQFFLQSPGYPGKYDPNLTCEFLLRGPECATFFKFDFIDFDLGNSVGCSKDRLEIENYDALCGTEDRIKIYLAENGSLHLNLRTEEGGSGNRFRILVTRMDCEKGPGDREYSTTESIETSTIQPTTDTTTPPFRPFNLPNPSPILPQCCTSNYNSKRFILTSPNFPYSLNRKNKCSIQIQKSNDDVCRIRLNFLFFWLGTTNYNSCPYGFLEIDGKYICGCNKELKLVTTFGTSNSKTLVFQSEGVNLNSQSGFVLEVIQDDCPKKYFPEIPSAGRNQSGLKVQKVRDNGVLWPSQVASVEKLQLINEVTNVDNDDNEFSNPRIIKSVYFFAAPDYNSIPIPTQDVEKTTYIDTESINSVITNFHRFECEQWNEIQLNVLTGRYGNDLQTCKQTEGAEERNVNDRNNCVELDYITGYFRSPGYPFYYPGGLNTCYRFKKQPGYCTIRVFMADFQIESSFACRKDYILLGNYNRFCGNKLFGQSLTLDLTYKNHEDVRFVTDDYWCGRGFSGFYQQIACQQTPIDPINPYNPFGPTTPATPSPSPPSCDRFVGGKIFTIDVAGNAEMCTFQIRKFSENVCKVNLVFEKFDLDCAVESLVVDDMMFCGHLSGRKVSVNMEGNEVKQLIYRSNSGNKYGDLKLKIAGEQITEDCLFPEVPLERLVKLGPSFFPNSLQDRIEETGNPQKYFVAMRNENLKEICLVVTKSMSKNLPENLCEILKNVHNTTECIILDTEYTYVPYQKNVLELKDHDTDVLKVEYEEIDCHSMNLNK